MTARDPDNMTPVELAAEVQKLRKHLAEWTAEVDADLRTMPPDQLRRAVQRERDLCDGTIKMCVKRTAERDQARLELSAAAVAMAGLLVRPAGPSELAMRALILWGADAQLAQVTEECAELIVAISHHRRGRIDDNGLANEAADVEFMIEQAAGIVGADVMAAARERSRAKVLAKIEAAEVTQ